MNKLFNQVKLTSVGSNTFDLSHDKKMSFDMGELIPIMVIDTIPGDKFNINTSQIIRFAPMIAPVMHQVNVFKHFFFVPNRLLWDNWQNFITGGEDGEDTSVFPYLPLAGSSNLVGELADYLGLPQNAHNGTINVSAMPFAAYQLIFNEYFRDENLQPKVPYKLVDGNNNANAASLAFKRGRAWEKDYFTSALPWTQKGVEATIPLGTSANIEYAPIIDGMVGFTKLRDVGTGALDASPTAALSGTNQALILKSGKGLNIDVSETHLVDLSDAAAASINDLRRAFRLQEWLEKNARGGSRYTESILAHFGVRSSDARLQRPEYLGGGKSTVQFSEVLQTAASDAATTPQGNMAGHGINVGANNGVTHYCEEHGYIIGLMSVLPRTAYFQGVPKHFTKFDKFDYAWPEFAHLGEQPIQNKELYLDTSQNMEATFGYTPRYAEYKFINSSVHGDFRTSLDFWHMSRKFSTLPVLNSTFIKSDPTQDIFAVQDASNKLYAHVYNNVRCSRKLPIFGTPTF